MKSFEEAINVRLIGVTQPVVDEIPDSEGMVSYTARVSNPNNQDNFDTALGLLKYCAREGHWSVFDMADAVVEIEAPRDISRQILRHQSNKFQEFSQRYAAVTEDMFCIREARLQDSKNRQNSIEFDDNDLHEWWELVQEEVIKLVNKRYNEALGYGFAKECARVILPEGNTMSRMYMKGSMRSWIHYCKLRKGSGTQLEHSMLIPKIRDELEKYFPNIVAMME